MPPSLFESSQMPPKSALFLPSSPDLAVIFHLSCMVFILASYICCRSCNRNSSNDNGGEDNGNGNHSSVTDGIILPCIIFVTEDNEELSRDNDGSVAVGLDQAEINSYPKFQFTKEGSMTVGDNTTCSICLCEYKDLEMLRMTPECRHLFHLCCIDAWLKLNGSCPVCQNSPLPTPLSEVVPLSQYATDRRRRM